jgi:hypothetical protein
MGGGLTGEAWVVEEEELAGGQGCGGDRAGVVRPIVCVVWLGRNERWWESPSSR